MKNLTLTAPEAAKLIAEGHPMMIAGAEALLTALPRGPWIGGTTVYFMTEQGGVMSSDLLFCTVLDDAAGASVRHLPTADLSKIPEGYVPGGATLILMPFQSPATAEFALNGAGWPGLFDQPLVGWVTGVAMDRMGAEKAGIVDGTTGAVHRDGAVVMHVTLPEGVATDIDIVNIFTASEDPERRFTFAETGFSATHAVVNGETVRLVDHFKALDLDTRLPFVANYAGAGINVSILAVDEATGRVDFAAPVIAGLEYAHARTLADYAEAFNAASGSDASGLLSCNCILNYLHGGMEGRKAGGFTGPVTFGEIAWILLNQTLVKLDVKAAIRAAA